MPGFLRFWNSKTGEERWRTRPVVRYGAELRAFVPGKLAASGGGADDLMWRGGESDLQAGNVECLSARPYAHVRWPALRRGAAAAYWATKRGFHYFKWWGRSQSTAATLQYATLWKDLDVMVATVLPLYSEEHLDGLTLDCFPLGVLRCIRGGSGRQLTAQTTMQVIHGSNTTANSNNGRRQQAHGRHAAEPASGGWQAR